MATRVFNFTTSFDRDGRTMIHEISKEVKVMIDFKTLEASVFKNGELVNKYDCSGMTLSTYGKLLETVSENAATIEKFESHVD
jgi:hypothetical protein